MIKKEINLYSFKELSKEVQEKVLNKFRDQEEHFTLEEDMQWKLEELLKENNIKGDGKIMYSLSYCQGDGAMFEGTFDYNGYTFPVKHSGHYYHYNSKSIGEITMADGEEVTDSKKYQELEKDFNDLYVEICKKLAKYGYSVMEEDLKDERIIENIEANEYTFRENGIIENI